MIKKKKIERYKRVKTNIVEFNRVDDKLLINVNGITYETIEIGKNAKLIKSFENDDEIHLFSIDNERILRIEIYFPENARAGIRVDVDRISKHIGNIRQASCLDDTLAITDEEHFELIKKSGSYTIGRCVGSKDIIFISKNILIIIANDGIHLIDLEKGKHEGISKEKLMEFNIKINDVIGCDVYIGEHEGNNVAILELKNKDITIAINIGGDKEFWFYVLENKRGAFNKFKD